MKKIFLIFLILFIISYSFAILPSEVSPQPTPTGPTGPEPGTGEKEHDQPTSEVHPAGIGYKGKTPIGFNLYTIKRFSVGNNVVYGGAICKNDEIKAEVDLKAEWFGKGGLTDSPPVQFYDLSYEEMIENLNDNILSPEPLFQRVAVFQSHQAWHTYPRIYINGSVVCSKSCSDLQEIDTSMLGSTNFNFNCNIKCAILRRNPPYFNRSYILVNASTYIYPLTFTNGIDSIHLSIPFNVVSSSEGPKLNLISYSHKYGQLLLTMQNNGDIGSKIDKVEFDVKAYLFLFPKKIDPGKEVEFMVNVYGAGKIKMDVYYRATDKGCLEQTSFKDTFEIDLSQPAAIVKPKTQPTTPTTSSKPRPQIPTTPPIKSQPTAPNPMPTKPISYGTSFCEDKTDVNNLKIDVGGFGVSQYSVDSLKKGESVTVNDVKITSAVNDYLKYCNSDECIIPIRIKADNGFELKVKDIKVVYKK